MTVEDEDQIFTTGEVCERLGVTARQLDWWCRSDYVRPSIRQAKGRGSRRLWAPEDIERVREVRDLMAGPRRVAEATRNA